MNQIIVLSTLLIIIALFIWDKVRYDFVALAGLFVISITGVIPIQTAFYGFSNPAVVTVVAIMILSKGMQHCGLMNWISTRVQVLGKSPILLIFPLSVLTAIASAFMNNVSIIMPLSLKMAKERNHPASLILMPLAFATLLGGMITLVGSAPNIIVSSVRTESMGDSFAIFDFFKVGMPLAVAGILYISFIGWRFLPNYAKTESEDMPALVEEKYFTNMIPAYLTILALSIVLVVFKLLPTHIAFPLGALLMVLTGVIPYKEAYTGVDWSVIVMLGALIPFGRAMTVSGTAAFIGNFLESLATISEPWVLVSILLLFTMLLTNLINNATTAIIMAPIAIGLAKSSGSSQDLYLMTVALGACSAFLTPIGHPANTLVKGPGSYRFGDYWKMGWVIQLINLVGGTILLIHYRG
jgi:anion transporter